MRTYAFILALVLSGLFFNTIVFAQYKIDASADNKPTEDLYLPDIETHIDTTICSDEAYEGYSQSGTYVDHFIAADGSDSIRTLVLVVLPCQPDCYSMNYVSYGSGFDMYQSCSLRPTPQHDGFYLLGSKADSVLLMKFDLHGNTLWSRAFEIAPGEEENPTVLLVDSEGMLVMAGVVGSLSATNGGGSIFVMRYNPNSNQVLWTKEHFTSTGKNYCLTLFQKEVNGHYVIANQPSDGSTFNLEMYELDQLTGEVTSGINKKYDLGSADDMISLVEYEGFIYGVGRFTNGFSPGDMRHTLAKFDPTTGEVIWMKMGHRPANATARLYGVDLVIEDDHIYSVYHGDQNGTSTDITKVYLQKTSIDGELEWVKQYDLPGAKDFVYEMITSDSGLVILGAQKAAADYQFIIFKVDFDGNVVWAKADPVSVDMNSDSPLLGESQLIELNDHLYFTSYLSWNATARQILVYRLNVDGSFMSGCHLFDSIEIPVTAISNAVFFDVHPAESAPTFTVQDRNAVSHFTTILFDLHCAYPDTSVSFIHARVCNGDDFEGYTLPGVYEDHFLNAEGCDSTRTLVLSTIQCAPIVSYNLNACSSFMSNGSHMDYSEFDSEYPTVPECAAVTATNVFRSPPQENKHSCTQGVDNSIAMCISANPSCTYLPGDAASLVFEVTVTPDQDSLFVINELEFFEKAPTTYAWISGSSGPNNYPKYYGLRILKNGQEVFRKKDIPTSTSWTLQSHDLSDIGAFSVDAPAVFRFELLPYCPVGNGAQVSAWDIDEIKISGGCIHSFLPDPVITGHVHNSNQTGIKNAALYLSTNASFTDADVKLTDFNGHYQFDELVHGEHYFLKGYKNDDVLNGLSTLDLIQIQKHLLGLRPFSTQAEWIAADINKNGTVDMLDLIALKKVLLGINSTFSNNTSWRFGQFDPANLFIEEFEIERLEQEALIDMTGIKVGDVTGDARPNLEDKLIENRSGKTLMWSYGDFVKLGNGQYSIPVFANEDLEFDGFQLTIIINDLAFAGITSGTIDVGDEDYSYGDQTLSISVANNTTINLRRGDQLFSLLLNQTPQQKQMESIGLLEDQMKAEVYEASKNYPLTITYNSANDDHATPLMSGISLQPNPFNGSTTLHFEMHHPGSVGFTIYTSSGLKIFETAKEFTAGAQSLTIDEHDISVDDAVLYLQMIMDEGVTVKKLIHIK